eukprot:6194621-Pleurochrysis_carterae.AAC.1
MDRDRQRIDRVRHLREEHPFGQVNHAGDGVGVVVFLFKPRHYASSYMLVLIEVCTRVRERMNRG